MIKKIAWDAFKNTGNIDAFLEFKEIENIQNKIGNTRKRCFNKNKWKRKYQ